MKTVGGASWRPLHVIGLLLTFTVVHAADLGTISGFVTFPEEAPPRNMFANAMDHACPHGIPQTHLLVKPYTRGLQNAMIVVDRQDRRVMPTRLQAELTLKGCEIVPRIQWLPLGASLAISNKDAASHHLIATKENNAMFEVKLPPGGGVARRPLVVPGIYKINCETHLWERAWIYVAPHDSVAISDAEGRFTVRNVPPGTYRLLIWHEGWKDKPKDPEGRPEFRPMQAFVPVKVRAGQDTPVLLDHWSPAD